MNDLDQKIQAALRRADAGDTLAGEPNLAEEVITAFRGRHRWLSTLMVVVNLVFFAGVIWSAVRFLGAGTVQAQMQWGALAFVLLVAVTSIKLWFWLELHTNRVLRELKRVELLLVTRAPAAPAKDLTSQA
jgi:hypothetical protein